MKLSKIALIVALVGVASLASAGPCTPVQYTCNTTVTISTPYLDPGSGVAMLDWTLGAAEIQSAVVYVTDGSGGPESVIPVVGNYFDPAFNPFPDGTIPATAANPIGYTANGLNFGIGIGVFFDPNPDASGGDFNATYPNLGQGPASLTFGVGTYFFQQYGFASGFGLVNNYFEVDIPIVESAPNGSDPGTPGGIWRLGFGVNTTGGNFLNTLFVAGGGDAVDNGTDYVILGNLAGPCAEGGCSSNLLFTDSEFDPNTTPEPTTLLLVGSGLLGLARRFRR